MNEKGCDASTINYKRTVREKKIRLNSLIISIAISINYISAALSNVFNLSNLLSISLLLIFIISFCNNNFKIKTKQIFFILITGLPVILSLFIGDINNHVQIRYILGYIMNGVIIAYLVSFEYEFKIICKYIISIFTFLIWTLVFFERSSYDYGSLMGWSYSAVPMFLVSIYILLYADNINYFKKSLVLFSCIIYILWIYEFISRGPVLAIIIYIMLLLFLNSKKSIRSIVFFMSALILIFLVVYFHEIINFFNEVLLRYDVNVRFLQKTLYLLDKGNLDNGRLYIYEKSWNSFKMHPIFGNGIAALDRLHGLEYDHLFILQLLNEIGIIFTFVHIVIILKGLLIMYNLWFNDKNTTRMLLLLFCSSIIRLSLSSVLWLDQGYWMFLYISFAYNKKNNKQALEHV